MRLFSPVILISGQRNLLVWLPVLEFEWAGTNWKTIDGQAVKISAERAGGHHRQGGGEDAKPPVIGPLPLDDKCVIIRCLITGEIGAGAAKRVSRVAGVQQRVHHRLDIARGHRIAVVKLDALAEPNRLSQTVWAFLEPFRQKRFHPVAGMVIPVELEKGLVDWA